MDKQTILNNITRLENELRAVGVSVGWVRKAVEALPDPAPVPPAPTPTLELRRAYNKYTAPSLDPLTYQFHNIQEHEYVNGEITRIHNSGSFVTLYATGVHRVSDDMQYTQTVDAAYSISWYLKDAKGNFVTRNNGDDRLLDPANIDYQLASIAFLVAKCRRTGADGITLDEVNQQWAWGQWDRYPVQYSNYQAPSELMTTWQKAQLSYVQALARGLHSAGLKLYINLGADYDIAKPWQFELVKVVDGICIEHFIAREGTKMPLAYWDTGFSRQAAFVQEVEWTYEKQVIAHASTTDSRKANYALLTYILAGERLGAFSASLDDDTQTHPSRELFNQISQLGAPLGAPSFQAPTSTRKFANGTVYVYPNERWASSYIELHSNQA